MGLAHGAHFLTYHHHQKHGAQTRPRFGPGKGDGNPLPIKLCPPASKIIEPCRVGGSGGQNPCKKSGPKVAQDQASAPQPRKSRSPVPVLAVINFNLVVGSSLWCGHLSTPFGKNLTCGGMWKGIASKGNGEDHRKSSQDLLDILARVLWGG